MIYAIFGMYVKNNERRFHAWWNLAENKIKIKRQRENPGTLIIQRAKILKQ